MKAGCPRAYLAAHPESLLLYAVSDDSWLDGRTLAQCCVDAVAGGATFVQLRAKNASSAQLVSTYREIKDALVEQGFANVPFVINDDVEAARLAGADGVHVGQSDASCAAAREALGDDAIVGVSAQTVPAALAAQAAGADYLGVGALLKTATKADAADVSIATLREICANVGIPVVGIGGLNEQTVDVLRMTGVQGAAVVSALFAQQDIREAAARLRALLEGLPLGAQGLRG